MLPCKTSQSPISEVVDNTQFSQKIGKQVRWGQEFLPGFASSISGQIIKTTSTTLTLQKGIPLLASIRGLVHISHNDLIEKNDLLITLRSRRLQTEDIVQGIPKIEQLFEARETQGGEIIQNNMHMLLSNFFNRALQVKPVPEAVQLSLTYIQKFLVENILQAYSNQGVHIAEKHVEVVVRQMTARVRITHGGETGFLPGEFVQLRLIEKVNLKLALLGEPVILGITKSVLQSESFLLAASFQQVSKVLVRSALSKKTDFLRGLHENILVGQPIPAGTGLIDLNHFIEKRAEALDDANSFRSSDLKSNSIQLN
jgi:DNA-directed RNA polymerase subunit beta'